MVGLNYNKVSESFSKKIVSILLVVHCMKILLGKIYHSLLYFAILTYINEL